MLQRMQRITLEVPSLGTVHTSYVGPAASSSDRPAFVLLHGFDSSLLEFRRFVPVLSEIADVYAVDLAGWGFSDCGFAANPDVTLGPDQKRDHLRVFIQQVVGRPVTLLGASLGGTVAIDFTLQHAELVERLVLCDAQVPLRIYMLMDRTDAGWQDGNSLIWHPAPTPFLMALICML
jgi:pimeloyl-ACP methyl ester carboxylesterase